MRSPVFVPRWLLATLLLVFVLLGSWTVALARGKNPLPFPDRNYAVFSTPTPAAQRAIIELLRSHGMEPRFRADSEGVDRAIFWDGTIINRPTPEMLALVGNPGAALGLVASDPVAAGRDAVQLLRDRGFSATLVEGAEPGLPIVFVLTDALTGSAIVIRKPVTQMGSPPARWVDDG
jgi:hypothetical protein